jgi:hypothetical protein
MHTKLNRAILGMATNYDRHVQFVRAVNILRVGRLMNSYIFVLSLALISWAGIPFAIFLASLWQSDEDLVFDWIVERYTPYSLNATCG